MDLNQIKRNKRIVSERIGEVVKQNDFCLSIDYLKRIHRSLFYEVYPLAGEFRNFNMTKREVILNGDSVKYSDCRNMYQDLFKAIINEYQLDYSSMDIETVVRYISLFAAKIWNVHPFIDGNTRTVAVYVQEYLKSLGYNVSNNVFKNECVYFRNALVKANYNNPEFFISADISALEKFFRKVLIDDDIELELSDVYIDGVVKINGGKKRTLTNN